MRKTITIPYERASEILADFVMECDLDDLAYIFGDVFGYDVTIDENENFACTPNGDCGFILEEGGKDVPFSDN